MLSVKNIGASQKNRINYWPIIEEFQGLDKELAKLLNLNNQELAEYFSQLFAQDVEQYSKIVMKTLGVIYGEYFSYKDSALRKNPDNDELQVALLRLKLFLEKEMIRNIIKSEKVPEQIINANDCYEYLAAFIASNSGRQHKFFDFVAQEINREQLEKFLLNEVIRNEVVDDEVAMIFPSLGVTLKQVIASNLWDECGNGNIDNFHTTWLYELIEVLNLEQKLLQYREERPWFAALTSNSFNSFLTSPTKKLEAFGHFLVTESWVCDHFIKIIAAMERHEITDNKARLYFSMHVKIDPHHAKEMLLAIVNNKPNLSQEELQSIIYGAHQACAAATLMYDKLLNYFTKSNSADNILH